MESTNNPRHRVDAGMRPFSSKRISRLLGFSALMVWLAPNAQANAGTPLLWATLLHLAFGNVLIGLLEGSLLARYFGPKKIRAACWMIAANYFSACTGMFLLRGVVQPRLHMDLNNGRMWFWVLAFAAYLTTLVMEWPFVAMCFRGSVDWFRKSWKANLLIQSVSYMLLFCWYGLASLNSLYRSFQVVPPVALSLPESVQVYYIADRDGNVYERKLHGGGERLVYALRSTNLHDRLVVLPASSAQTNAWNLVARMVVEGSREARLADVERNLIGQAGWDELSEEELKSSTGSRSGFGKVIRLDEVSKSDWTFWSYPWSGAGLNGKNSVKGSHFALSDETVFERWPVRNAVHLPGDLVLFQLGANQICVLDPNTKRVALLAHGRGPVAVIPTAMK